MISISSEEAILFRLLVAFFGEDQVIPHMSVRAVCGGTVPEFRNDSLSRDVQSSCHKSLEAWASEIKCLFTIVNHQSVPRMVIELMEDFSEVVDLQVLQRQRYLRPLLQAAGVPYVTMSQDEFSEITNPASKYDLFAFLKSKIEYFEAEL
jgi:hypothetical protein